MTAKSLVQSFSRTLKRKCQGVVLLIKAIPACGAGCMKLGRLPESSSAPSDFACSTDAASGLRFSVSLWPLTLHYGLVKR